MFEGIIIGLIVFAVGYTLAMRLMARRADVLYGEFILSRTASRSERVKTVVAALSRVLSGARSFARR